MKYHESVLVEEVIDYLQPEKGKSFIDATIGGGGHTAELIKRGSKVLGIDRDEEAVEHVRENQKLNIKNKKLMLVKANFNQIEETAVKYGFNQVDGILFDLGVSSNQLNKGERGFSFQKEGPLDMRMDKNLPIKASDIVNNLEERRLSEIFSSYAEEKFSWPIARAICGARQIKPITETKELADLVREVYRKKRFRTKVDPATKVFQALRIVINSELLNLEETLPQTTKILRKGGRLVIISYHSLEDSIVKRFFKASIKLKVLTAKPVGPQEIEIKRNPRSRSAKLRAAEKIIN